MTEKEKMLAGEFYNTRDAELLYLCHNARKLLDLFNNTSSQEVEKKVEILKNLFGHLGKEVWIEKPFFCDYGENISLGDNTFINFNCIFLDCNKITIGKNVLIAPHVQIYTASHPIKASERIPKVRSKNSAPNNTFSKPVIIGDNIWIGGNAVILPGVTIGSNTVIGAGSVVTKDIPANCVAVGNPCRVVKANIE
ncbi:MAG: sugar O-acetyltransferase [Clostridia bacterium]|nr:sugar O-acetyltransferase [Clostridia bacterium]MDD4048849.1 sugar O-acetyltransferase [Clostridia bacterium]